MSKLTLKHAQLVAVSGLRQFCRKGGRILEQDSVSLQASLDAKRNRDVRFTATWIADHDNVAALINKLAGGKFPQEYR